MIPPSRTPPSDVKRLVHRTDLKRNSHEVTCGAGVASASLRDDELVVVGANGVATTITMSSRVRPIRHRASA